MTSPSPLRWRLREATSQAHARLDARLAPAFHTREGYAAFLLGMHRFSQAASRATGDAAQSAATAALRGDLSDLGLVPLAPARLPAVSPASAPGWRYVAAGAALGARLLLPRARALGFDAGHGARYLAAQAQGGAWRDFLADIDAIDPADTEAACAGAVAAFALAEASMGDGFVAVAA
jgi:heme oxygenase